MRRYAGTVGRGLIALLTLHALALPATASPRPTPMPVHIGDINHPSPGQTISMQELPNVPPDLAMDLMSPEVNEALGGPADPSQAKAVLLGQEGVRAVSAPAMDGNAVVVVARDRAGRTRILTVRGVTRDAVALESGGAKFQLAFRAMGDRLEAELTPVESNTFESPRVSPDRRSASPDLVKECFLQCASDHVPRCGTSCTDCMTGGSRWRCIVCFVCVGYWGIYCAVNCM
jgi:hypothetical protein